MHHLYPSLKGDQLCPLGFHPQTRYPTRCKRCFRDYKEHGGRRGVDDVASSSPNLSDVSNARPSRSWTSTQNLSSFNGAESSNDIALKKRPLSWASTPDIDDQPKKSNSYGNKSNDVNNSVDVTVKLPIPPRRHTTILDMKEVEDTISQNRPASSTKIAASSSAKNIPEELIILSTDSLAERVRKMNLLKKFRSQNSRESSRERSTASETGNENSKLPPDRQKANQPLPSLASASESTNVSLPPKKVSINLIQSEVKLIKQPASLATPKDSMKKLDPIVEKANNIGSRAVSSSDTDNKLTSKQPSTKQKILKNSESLTTIKGEDSILSHKNLQEELNNLRLDFDKMRLRAEKAEREKSDILLRRLASMETAPNRTAASEAIMLQQKVNELKDQLERVNEEKRRLNTRMKELENNPKSNEHGLKKKLQAAEKLCEELMDEKQELNKEIMTMQAEMDEIQDTFRDDEVKAKTNLQKDLERATKNCRILSFKLKKSEKKMEDLERERQKSSNEELINKIKKLEEELKFANELTRNLQVEADELRNQGKKKAPMLGVIGKSTSADGKFTRESLTRGGSQEDPQQLLRDLKDSVEREDDLKEQLKYAEEEAENLRKKLTRFEDENDSLMLQLRKMATRSKNPAERDEGISDDDDPTELRILLDLNEQEASILRLKVDNLEKENNDIKRHVRELQEKVRKQPNNKVPTIEDQKFKTLNNELSQSKITLAERDHTVARLQSQLKTATEESIQIRELTKERDDLNIRLKSILQKSKGELQPRVPKRINDLTPKNQLKKWIEELESEIDELRAIILINGGDKIKQVESDKTKLDEELQKTKQKLSLAEGDIQRLKSSALATSKVSDIEQKLKKSEDESKKLATKVKELDDKLKRQNAQIKQLESGKDSSEQQLKYEKEKLVLMEQSFEKERKEREKLDQVKLKLENQLTDAQKSAEKSKASLEKDIKELKSIASKSDSKKTSELKNQIEELKVSLSDETKKYNSLNLLWEKLSEETILMRAQLTTEKQNLEVELNTLKLKAEETDRIRSEKVELSKKIVEYQKKIRELESKDIKNSSTEYEKTMLRNKLSEKEAEYDRLRRENEMNIDLVFQLRKDNDDLNRKLNDFNRIEQAQSSLNGHSASLESDIKSLKIKLENSELLLKSEVAATRLRYEQQVKNLREELTSMQRQCESFKKDRDTFKKLLETAQKKIGDLKASNTGRQSRGSMHSSDDDDKSKIAYLEKQVGCLEDQLVEARLEVSKVKTELISERSANEIKISEMQSKLNEFEEDRVINTGRTKIPGMKTKLELSWQKEREDQQRLLQETSTLARDLRQTLFEVERERDKERLESKRRLDQLKRATEEEMEEGRKKIAELQCDLLELRDVHAKLRTSNEKLRRERERYEKEITKRRMEQEGGERKLNALQQTVDELIKVAPDLKLNCSKVSSKSSTLKNTLQPEQASNRLSRSPSPTLGESHLSSMLTRLAEAAEELRKFQLMSEDLLERNKLKRGSLRRAASQENENHGSTGSVSSIGAGSRGGSRLSRTSNHNGSLIRKSLSLDQAMQQDQTIWRQDDGSFSSIQSIDSDFGARIRDSSYDSRLSGGSTQSDIPRGPRKKKKGLIGKLRSLTKSSRNSESEISVQGSDSDLSIASDIKSSKKDLRDRLSGMFKRSGSASRSGSTERTATEQKPVAVVVVGDVDGPQPKDPPPANVAIPKPIRSINKPPTPSPTTPLTKRRLAK